MTPLQWAEVQHWNRFVKMWKQIGADVMNRANQSPVPTFDLGPILLDVSADEVVRSCGGKRRYSTEAIANAVAIRCFNERAVSLRVYPCTICGGVSRHQSERRTPDARGLATSAGQRAAAEHGTQAKAPPVT